VILPKLESQSPTCAIVVEICQSSLVSRRCLNVGPTAPSAIQNAMEVNRMVYTPTLPYLKLERFCILKFFFELRYVKSFEINKKCIMMQYIYVVRDHVIKCWQLVAFVADVLQLVCPRLMVPLCDP
jgi:hypothetical protein